MLKTCKWWSGRTSSIPRNSVACSGSLDFNEGDGISYKGDNSTLAPAFPVLSVGFVSSDIESVILCQVGLLDGARINAVLLQEVLKLCFLLTHSFSIPVC